LNELLKMAKTVASTDQLFASVRSTPPPPRPGETRREHRLDDGGADDAGADSSSRELEEPETGEQREAEVECANPATNDKRAIGRLDAPFLEHGSSGEDEAQAENAAANVITNAIILKVIVGLRGSVAYRRRLPKEAALHLREPREPQNKESPGSAQTQ
jgi:hypothetical protein